MEFFEHDTWGQGNSAVGEASPRIPLVIRDPRRPASGKVDQVVRSIDLAPTLLELAGQPPAPAMDGVSLAGCLSADSACPELDAFNETGIWIADIPGLPDDHLRYPDLLELIEVPDQCQRHAGDQAGILRCHPCRQGQNDPARELETGVSTTGKRLCAKTVRSGKRPRLPARCISTAPGSAG